MIDDEIDYCMIMENFFVQQNYDVKLAFTIQDGLERLATYGPDILILDNNLPDGRGWDHVESIVEKNPHLKIFLISAYSNKEIAEKYVSPNITILEKPLSFKLLKNYF